MCPYCGKTFKRLKGHLPHCKAKEHSEPSQTQHDLTASKDTLSKPPLSSTATSFSSEKARKRTAIKESLMKTPLTKNDKESRLLAMSESLPPSTPLKTESYQSSPLMPSPVRSSSVSQPSSSKKKTQSLAAQIKMATLTSSISPSASLPSPSEPSNTSSALKQTATPKQVTKGPLKQAQSKPQLKSSDQLPDAFRPVADTANSAALLSTRQEAGKKQPALVAPETQLEGSSKTKGMSSRLPLTTQMSGLSDERIPLDGVLGTIRTPTKILEDGGLQNVYGAHARATLQNVKDTLRRSKGIGQPGKLSLLDRLQSSMPTRDWRSGETEFKDPIGVSQDQTGIMAPLRNANSIGPLLTSTSPSNQLPDTSSQVSGLSPFERLPALPPQNEGFIPAGTTHLSPPPLQGPALQSSLASTAGLILRYEISLLPTSSSVTRPVEATPACAESGGVKGRIIMEDPEVIFRNLKLKNAIEG